MVKRLNQHIGQNGAAAVEFAIVLPLLLILVFGIVEFSILFYNKAMITNASREGARAGIVLTETYDADGNAVNETYDDIASVAIDKVEAYCKDYLITFGDVNTEPTVTVTPTGTGEPAAGDSLTVKVEYDYKFLFLPNFISGLGGHLSAVTVMRMEGY